MIIDLTGRKAIVTGSTAGIGRATAEGLARAGAAVVVNGRTSARVEEAVRQIRQTVPDAAITGVAADMATAEGVAALIAAAPDADILVNNVGTAHIREYRGVDDLAALPDADRSEARRAGHGWVSPCSHRLSADQQKKKK